MPLSSAVRDEDLQAGGRPEALDEDLGSVALPPVGGEGPDVRASVADGHACRAGLTLAWGRQLSQEVLRP